MNFKKMMIAILGVAVFSTANAKDVHTKCSNVAEAAEAMQEANQRSVPISSVFGAINRLPGGGTQILKEMVLDAYDYPTFASQEYRQKYINRFSNKWYTRCIRNPSEF